MKWIIPFLASFVLCNEMFSQRIKTGQQVPDMILHKVINNPSGILNLKDYRGKVLVLDFWATWCSPCLAAFAKTEKLVDKLGDKIQILPVTYQSYQEVEKTVTRLRRHNGLKMIMPMVIADTLLQGYFPHNALPHYVWINKKGIVVAVTDADAVSEENLNAVAADKQISVAMKVDVKTPYRIEEMLIAQNTTINTKPVKYQSAITTYIEGLPSSYTVFPVDSVNGHRVVATNARIPTLYKIAYGNLVGHYFPESSILLEMQDTTCCNSSLYGMPYLEWLSGRAFCYELIVPNYMLGQQAAIMQADLKRFFPNYSAKVEQRFRRAFVLESLPGEDKLKTKGGKTASSFEPYDTHMTNCQIGLLVLKLNYFLQHLGIPIVDGTGYTGAVDIDLNVSMTDIETLRKALNSYHLDLTEKDYEIKVLVISDKPGN